MSQIQNRIVTTFAANQGNSIAVMNQIAGGMTNIGRASMGASRQTGLFDQQMRAFGTTLRYAFAGSVLFGATRMLTTLRDTQRQLGLISVLGGDAFDTGKMQQGTMSLEKFYNQAQKGAYESLTPTNEFNDGLINLFSTVQGLKADQAVTMMTEFSKAATIAQVPAEEMTKTVTTMATAFGMKAGNLDNVRKFMAGFFTLTSQAPGGISAGPQFIQALPNLAAVGRFANITPSQMFGTYLTGLRGGATPATVARGQQFMFQSLAVPASDEAKKALATAGITPGQVQKGGGINALARLIAHAQQLGIRGVDEANTKFKTPESLDALEAMEPGKIGGTLGISGPGAEFLTTSLGRIHAVRAAITLIAQERANHQLTKDIQLADKNMASGARGAKLIDENFRKFAAQNPLAALAIAIDNTRRQFVTAFAGPIINPLTEFAAPKLQGLSEVMGRHPRRTLAAAGGVASAVALTKLLRGGAIGGLLGRGAGSSFVAAQSIEAMANPKAGPGMSPTNPLFVIVVGQIFGNPIMGGPPGGGLKQATQDLPDGPIPVPWWKRGLKKAAWGLGRASLPLTASFGVNEGINKLWPDYPWTHMDLDPGVGGFKKDFGALSSMFGGHGNWDKAKAANNRVEGRAHVSVDVNVMQGGTKVNRKRIHVPMNLWSQGTTPSSRGGRPRRGGT